MVKERKDSKVLKRLSHNVTLYRDHVDINGEDLMYSDIMSCTITDPKAQWAEELGLPTEKVSAPLSGIIGRSIAGGILAGPVGTIIGGVTAPKKKKKISYGHNYVVRILIPNNKKTYIDVAFGEELEKALELKNFIDAMIPKI